MSQPQTVEEIMQRIRAQLRKPDPGAGGNEAQGNSVQATEIVGQPRQESGSPQQADRRESTETRTSINIKLHETSQLRTEINTAVEGTRRVGQINPRDPGLINNFIQMVKKVMRRSLTWYTRPLHEFQGGVVRALNQIAAILDNHNDSWRKVAAELRNQAAAIEQGSVRLARAETASLQKSANLERQIGLLEQKTGSIEHQTASAETASLQKSANLERQIGLLEHQTASLEQRATSLENKIDEAVKSVDAKLGESHLVHEGRIAAITAAQSEQIARLAGDVEALRSELVKTRAELRDSNARGRVRDRDVRRTRYSLQNGPARNDDNRPATPPMFASEVKSDKEFDYFAFEDLYRGDEADIRSRQQEYLEYFRGCENVVDIGCGRGEFLELLRDNNIGARGVELGLDQYLLCKEKGLDVVQLDLFTFLESLPDESLGGLFSAQVIEHLTASDQLRYVALAHRKTKPGSPVIFETINAQCVYAVMRNFFLDPTHIRPVHPETLKFAMETMQFKNVELRFSGPLSDKQIPPLKLNGDTPQLAEFNRSLQELNNLIYGYQDYAAVGWR